MAEPRRSSLFEMIAHPWATLAKIQGLDRLPDRRVSKHRYGFGAAPDPVDPLRRQSRIQSIYKSLGIYALEESRVELYENFREMSSDPMIAAMLEAFASQAAEKDSEHKRIVWVESANADIRKIVTETLDRLHIDEWTGPIFYALSRDADVMMHVATARGVGVVALRPYEPWTVARIEDDIGRLIGFAPANEQGLPSQTDRSSVPHYRVLHFRLPPRELTDHYGASGSFLWGSRLLWRQIQLMEDQVVIQRLLRRPDRLLVLLDTAGLSHDESWQVVKDWERRLHREWYANPQAASFASMGTPLDIAKDVVLPRGAANQTQIENFPATNNNDILRDLEMFYNRLATGIGFPLAFFGRGDAGSYQPGQSLARQWHPFAKKANKLQQAFLPELVRLCMIDLAFKGLDPMRPENAFTLHMSTVSPIAEIERNEIVQLKTDRMERALAFGQQAGLDMDIWTPMVLEKYGGFSKEFIKKVYKGQPAPAVGPDGQPAAGGVAPPAQPTLPPIAYTQIQNEGRRPTDDDVRALEEMMAREAGELMPEVEDKVSCYSHTAIVPLAEETHPWRPKVERLDEGHADRKALEEKLMLGNERLVGDKATLEATNADRAEKRRKLAETRLELMTMASGMIVDGQV
jgi:hypothetical protein